MLSPTLFIEAKDFHNAWARAVRFVLRRGEKQTIGDIHEPKHITDACGLITLSGNAIEQIEVHEIHPQYPFKHIKQYCAEFTHEFVSTHTGLCVPEKERFDYLYFDRLTRRLIWTGLVGSDPLILDQLRYMRIALADQITSGISSNRSQAITWEPDLDIESIQDGIDVAAIATPCLQRVWVRYLGNNEVEVHLTWRCYDSETEVLTTAGWKHFKDVKMVDTIATLNETTDELEYHKPTSLFEYDYAGEMYHFEGKKIDLLVTPNHQMYVKRYPSKEYGFISADECNHTNTIIKKTCTWKGEHEDIHVLPATSKHRRITNSRNGAIIVPERAIDMNNWLNFLGWYISEGSLSFTNRSYRVIISQQKEEYRLEIYNSFIRIGCNVCKSGVSFVVGNKQLYKHLETQGKQHMRFVPDYVKNLDPSQIKVFLRSLFLGDGHKLFFDDDYNLIFNSSGKYTTVSKQLADDVQELLLKIGVQSVIHWYDRDNRHQRTYTITPSQYTESWITVRNTEQYHGKIYCCDVPNHLIMVRRNGIIHWCGNSRDLYTAWQSNMIALVDMVNREIVLPNGCKIVKIVDFSDSLHVYDGDAEAAAQVKLVPENPQWS